MANPEQHDLDVDATIVRIEQQTPTVKSFLFDLGGGQLTFLPGQWVDLYIDTGLSAEVGGYSITSSPLQPGAIELAVKKLPFSRASTYLHERAREGDTFIIRGGFGEFYYDQSRNGPTALIAGGIGITPFMSMLRYIDEAGLAAEVTIIYSARTASELLFLRELEQLAARNPGMNSIFTVTGPGTQDWTGSRGRIGAGLIQEQGLPPDSLYYLCGPPGFEEEISTLLGSLGVSPGHIKVERWW